MTLQLTFQARKLKTIMFSKRGCKLQRIFTVQFVQLYSLYNFVPSKVISAFSFSALVTHGCIVATVTLFLPDGKEATK